jgi:tetratricopeptide (TPR) repeat protein
VEIGHLKFHVILTAPFVFATALVLPGQQAQTPVALIDASIRSHKYDQALRIAEAALLQTPDDSRLWTLKGIVFSLEGSKRDALTAFDKALELSPDDMAAMKGEVQLFYQAEDSRAIPLLQRIVKADPKDETAHEMLATLEVRQGNCQTAIDNFLLSAKALASHPGSLEAYGDCLVRTDQPLKAIPVFEQLAAILPQRAYPKFDVAVLLVQTRQYDAAVKVLEPILAADQSDPELLSLASEAYEALGDTPRAVSLLRQAIVLSPTNASYYNAFVVLCLDHESYKVGVDMLNAGLQRIPEDPSLYISRGLLYSQLAQYDKAEADFNTAEQLDSKQSLSAYAKDIVELQKNMSDKSPPESALLEIRSQLKAHPDSALLHFLLAKLLLYQVSDFDAQVIGEATASALMALRLKPDLVEARDLLASIYTRSGQYSLALEQCRLALQYSPSDTTAIYHLIVALRHSGQIGQRDEIQALVKRLSGLQAASRQQQTDKKRFQIIEQQAVSPH